MFNVSSTQSNKKEMEKQQSCDKKIDNGMKSLIERYPSLRSKYVKGVTNHLKLIPGAKIYDRHQISRVIKDEAALNDDNKVIKDAFMNRAKELVPNLELA